MNEAENSKDSTFSVRRYIGYSVFITASFLLVHALGFRENTSVISGIPTGHKEAFLGLVYVLTYFAFIGLVPILLIAAAILTIWGKLHAARKSTSPEN
ncbi:MAG TPA: hypothetical protein DET40_12840 [Lentisphaeria bacterium]|nr:MAG: hypothetical protein A2X45_13765 [Lentisphaerae bacterium GWF2_50_93]HCE44427.1 hypothetical protein [Lentisphaeria bacterium]